MGSVLPGGIVRRGVVVLGLIVALAAVVPWALASRRRPLPQCTQADDWKDLRATLADAVACNDASLQNGAVSCSTSTPPLCARSLASDVVTLAYGAERVAPGPYDPALEAQFQCQEQIGQAAFRYPYRRLRLRIEGQDGDHADALARAELDAIPAACSVDVAQDANGLVLPAVGPQCGAAVGAPGTPVDGEALRDCLNVLFAQWVERIGPEPAALRPNIVFILTDDQRWDAVGSTHAPAGEVVMPSVMSELVASGVTFDSAFVSTPLCCPSRATILTGQYAHTSGVRLSQPPDGGAVVFDDSSTLATWLHAAGYRTGLFGKYLNGYQSLWTNTEPPYRPPGWDEWVAFKNPGYYDYVLVEDGVEVAYDSNASDYSTDVLLDRALAYLDEAVAAGDPFLLYWVPLAPHSPYISAPRHGSLFRSLPPWQPASYNEPDVSDKPPYIANRALRPAGADDFIRASQLRTLQSVDEGVAAIMQRLRQYGIADQTIVIFTSDNGYYWGEHRLTGKHKPYEEAIRVPLVIRYPPLAPLPRREARFALNLDFAPTLLELAGAIAGIPLEGRSLVRVLDGTQQAWRSDLLTEGWPPGKEWATLRQERWKFTEYPNQSPGLELYDLLLDPLELENLAADPAYAARIASMRDRMLELRPAWPQDAEATSP